MYAQSDAMPVNQCLCNCTLDADCVDVIAISISDEQDSRFSLTDRRYRYMVPIGMERKRTEC